MTTAKCFVCNQEYGSDNPDDLAGDGRCPKCEEMRKAVAFKVDIEIAEKRKHNPLVPNERSEMIKELFEKGGQIRARDLGIF